MAIGRLTQQALEAWTATLDRMQQGLGEMLERSSAPQSPPPIQGKDSACRPLDRIDGRLVDLEGCLQGLESTVATAEAASNTELTELQAWTAHMAAARAKLARAADRAL